MKEEIEQRTARLEKTQESEEKIRRLEYIATRIGGFMILLITLLVILLNKLADVVLAITRTIRHAFGR